MTWVERYREVAGAGDEPLVSSAGVSRPNSALYVDWSPYYGASCGPMKPERPRSPLTELQGIMAEASNECAAGWLLRVQRAGRKN